MRGTILKKKNFKIGLNGSILSIMKTIADNWIYKKNNWNTIRSHVE